MYLNHDAMSLLLTFLACYLQLADLARKQELFESAQAELNALYNRIFDGPSEGEYTTG